MAIAIPADGKGLPPGSGDLREGQAGLRDRLRGLPRRRPQGRGGLPRHAAGAALRLIGGRGTLTHQKPIVTVESYWPYATTLFDYTRRAMPFRRRDR